MAGLTWSVGIRLKHVLWWPVHNLCTRSVPLGTLRTSSTGGSAFIKKVEVTFFVTTKMSFVHWWWPARMYGMLHRHQVAPEIENMEVCLQISNFVLRGMTSFFGWENWVKAEKHKKTKRQNDFLLGVSTVYHVATFKWYIAIALWKLSCAQKHLHIYFTVN